jgi:hypothetical protein
MVSAIAGHHDVERRRRAGQSLGGSLLNNHVAQSSMLGFFRDHGEHRLGKIIGHHLLYQWRQPERRMSAAASHVQSKGAGSLSDQTGHEIQVLAASMHGAGQIGSRLRAELAADDGLVCFRAHVRSRSEDDERQDEPVVTLVQDGKISWYKSHHERDRFAPRPRPIPARPP